MGVQKTAKPNNPSPSRNAIRLGFVPLVDAAPLIVAREKGIFDRYGLSVRLLRQPGWTTVRDKLVYGRELDVSHAPGGLIVAINLGLGCVQSRCVTPLGLNANGNAITLSAELWGKGVTSLQELVEYVKTSREEKLCFGVVHPFSSHNFLLSTWLRSGGLDPSQDVSISIVPPELMQTNMRRGNLAGSCVGEPWASAIVKSASGYCVTTTAEVCAEHPEKLLLARGKFAEDREEELILLTAAILDACEYCASPENHKAITALLSRSAYLDVSEDVIMNSLGKEFDCGGGRKISAEGFHLFTGESVNRPSPEIANWLLSQVRQCGLLTSTDAFPISEVFREDLYERAIEARQNGVVPKKSLPTARPARRSSESRRGKHHPVPNIHPSPIQTYAN